MTNKLYINKNKTGKNKIGKFFLISLICLANFAISAEAETNTELDTKTATTQVVIEDTPTPKADTPDVTGKKEDAINDKNTRDEIIATLRHYSGDETRIFSPEEITTFGTAMATKNSIIVGATLLQILTKGNSNFDKNKNSHGDNNSFGGFGGFGGKTNYAKEEWVVGANKALKNGVLGGLDNGINQAVASLVTSMAINLMPNAKNSGAYASAIFQKVIYGDIPLTYRDLALLNNEIYNLVDQFTKNSATDYAKERRAAAIEDEEDQNQEKISDNWSRLSKSLTKILEFNYSQIKQYSYSHSLSREKYYRLSPMTWAANIVNFFSIKPNSTIAHECEIAMDNISAITDIINSTRSIKEFSQQRETIKAHLNIVCLLLEHVANMCDSEGKGPKFLKPAGSGSNELNDIAAMLGGR